MVYTQPYKGISHVQKRLMKAQVLRDGSIKVKYTAKTIKKYKIKTKRTWVEQIIKEHG